ncbi:vomeronasal type-1 receptor 4-like [Perognathus longimembris pacificus]|uniref:vomeronasal type-1 receptor 4-like n=1 Tax=Perognathus longimembris pacificus TaxID=214514 RepID=UPI00201994FE|nr:vomeronasal type-1 receptor 4-like [Perognathus longimembris pacificus]
MFRILLLSKVCLGVLGNCVLFLVYTYSSVRQPQLRKPINTVFMHLTLVNALTIMFESTPFLISSFGVTCFWDDTTCMVVLYLFRVTRGMSICTTTFLSAFQALTISPAHARWAWLKSRSASCILPSLLSFWFLNSLVYFYVVEPVVSNCNSTATGTGFSHPFCQVRSGNNSAPLVSSFVLQDVLFLVLMITTSLYMVILLRRHCQRARHLHNGSLTSQPRPKNRATNTILTLVSCFVFFYCCNNIVTLYSLYTHEKWNNSKGATVLLSFGYPTLCPFLLMKNNRMFSQWTTHLWTRITHCKTA